MIKEEFQRVKSNLNGVHRLIKSTLKKLRPKMKPILLDKAHHESWLMSIINLGIFRICLHRLYCLWVIIFCLLIVVLCLVLHDLQLSQLMASGIPLHTPHTPCPGDQIIIIIFFIREACNGGGLWPFDITVFIAAESKLNPWNGNPSAYRKPI